MTRPYNNPKFWFGLISLILMISGFLVQQATRIPLVEKLIIGDAAVARRGFDGLLFKSTTISRSMGFGGNLEGRPYITYSDSGFKELAYLYTCFIASEGMNNKPKGQITRFIDACALVSDKRGLANLILLEWNNGNYTNTSYEEIRELIANKYDNTIRPVQYLLFGIGFAVALVTFMITYFLKEKST